MKVILVNGSPHVNGCTYTALCEVEKALKEDGIETEIFQLGTDSYAGCIGCNACIPEGKCFRNDKVNEFVEKAKEADGFIFGSPVHYAAASGSITSFLDRVFYGKSKIYAGKPGAVVVSCRRGGASAAFDQLNKYFTISSMPIVSSTYWNQVHGTSAAEVLKDEEGMQTMRNLGHNMSWLIKCISEGKKSGVEMPEQEKQFKTSFID